MKYNKGGNINYWMNSLTSECINKCNDIFIKKFMVKNEEWTIFSCDHWVVKLSVCIISTVALHESAWT